MVNRKRLLCAALSCLLSISNLSVSHASSKLNENQIYDLMVGCLDNADRAIRNVNHDKSSGYTSFPSCKGAFAVNAYCSRKNISDRNFIRGIVMEMMLSTFMFHLNQAHMMTPKERKDNWNSTSVKIARWLGNGELPEGTQNSYSFWTHENADLFNTCQWNASEQAYDLMEELLNNYDEMYGSYEKVFSNAFKKALASDPNAKNKNVNKKQKVSKLSDEEVQNVKRYILGQIKDAFGHKVFLKKSDYLVLPTCKGEWAANVYCSPELVKNPDFARGVIIDIILSIFMFSLNKTYHMSPEEREDNKDKIYVKISRWLGEGNLPEGTQNSYAFWKNNDNIKLFNICQCNACDCAYDLMEEHFNVYESQNGPKSIQRIFESLYDESDDVNNAKNQEQSEHSVSDKVKTSDSITKDENVNNDSSKEKDSSKNIEDDLETNFDEENSDENIENSLPVETEI